MPKRTLLDYLRNLFSGLGSAVGLLYLLSVAAGYLAWFGFEARPAVDSRDGATLASAADEYWQRAHVASGVQGHLLVMKEGEVLHTRSYGYAEEDAVTAGTQFYIASVSKQMTATIIYALQDEGKLDVSDLVCRHIEHFCIGNLARVRIEHLLTHTAGLPRIPFSLSGILTSYRSLVAPVSLQTLVAAQSPESDLSEPGTKFRYSNYGYDVLSAIVEKVKGHAFSKAALAFVKEKAALEKTYVQNSMDSRSLDLSGRYLFRLPFTVKTVYIPMGHLSLYENAFGSGGFVSTPRDLAIWSTKLMEGELLTTKSRKELWRPRLENYASGWVVEASGSNSESVVWHNGKLPGFFSALALYPQRNTVVVWLSNSHMTSKSEKRILNEFDRLLFGKPYSVATERLMFPSLSME